MRAITEHQRQVITEALSRAQTMYDKIVHEKKGNDKPCEQLHYWDGKVQAYKHVVQTLDLA